MCTAGNLRTTLLLADLVRKADQFDRFLIATDTPTGSGIMPLGMMYTITHLASLTDMPVEWAIAAATGNNARVYRLNSGFLKPGRDADVVLLDACVGGSKDNALDALRNGDIAAVARGRHRRRAALRRPQPQHAGADAQCARRRVPHSAGLHRVRPLNRRITMPRHKNYLPHGVIPAALLPFHEDLSIDAASYRSHLRDVASVEGISAITINAHATEVASCSFDEQKYVLELTQDEIGERLPIVNGIYSEGPFEAARRGRSGGASPPPIFPDRKNAP